MTRRPVTTLEQLAELVADVEQLAAAEPLVLRRIEEALEHQARAEAAAWRTWRGMRARGLRMSDAGRLVRSMEALQARARGT